MPKFTKEEYIPEPVDTCWICKRSVEQIQEQIATQYPSVLMKRYFAAIKIHPVDEKPRFILDERETVELSLPSDAYDISVKDVTESRLPIYICAICYNLMRRSSSRL